MFYVCLRYRQDKHDQGEQKIIKKGFSTRDEARAYITAIQNDETKRDSYDQFWTE